MILSKTSGIISAMCLLSLSSASLRAETVYGPDTITIPTNQAIVINTIGSGTQLYIDGQIINADPAAYNRQQPSLRNRRTSHIQAAHRLL